MSFLLVNLLSTAVDYSARTIEIPYTVCSSLFGWPFKNIRQTIVEEITNGRILNACYIIV